MKAATLCLSACLSTALTGLFSAAAAADPPSGRPYDGIECAQARRFFAGGVRNPIGESWARACIAKGGVVVIPPAAIPAPRGPAMPSPAMARGAPMATRAPPAPSGGLPSPPAGPVRPAAEWADELPTLQAVHDALPRDGEALGRGQATFTILKDYIAFRKNPASGLPTSASSDVTAQTRLSEYQRTQTLLNFASAAMAGPIEALVSSPAFRQETLARFISQPALDAYLAYAQVQSRSALTQADAFAERTKALSAAAKQANVDMGVFGIELGKPLSLPPCPDNMNGQPAETCRVNGFGFAALGDQFAINGDFATVPGTVNVSVKLGAAKCPDWIDCTLLVATKEGYALSVSFLTTGADGQDAIEARLSQKYHANPTAKNTYSECHVKYGGADLGSNARAANRIWTLTGLTVAYIPYGSVTNCRQGAVRVATTGYGEVVEHANQEHEASQPKM